MLSFKSLKILSIVLLDLYKLYENRVCVEFISLSLKALSKLLYINRFLMAFWSNGFIFNILRK